MFSKDVCMKCTEEKRCRGWTETKERNWEAKHRVWCIGKDDMRCGRRGLARNWPIKPWVNLSALVPAECYYPLEQMVLGQDDGES